MRTTNRPTLSMPSSSSTSAIFLAALAEKDGAPATATGNLTRIFVSQMFDHLKLTQLPRDSIRRFCKVVNEQDVRALHLVRVISECAKLVARRKKRFHLH